MSALSLCMIARDEAGFLKRCLESVRGLVDEIIVVDTGSSDETPQVAEAFGAKVIHHLWQNNFAEARNVALDHATKDWILSLDCDEIIARRDHEVLRRCLKRSDVMGYQITTRNYTGEQNSIRWQACDGSYPAEERGYPGWFPSSKVRLYRNDPRIRYEGIVHEVVQPTIFRIGGKVAECLIPVHHYGYMEKTPRKETYVKLLERKAEENPDHPKALFELASAYCDVGRIADSEPVMRRVVDFIKAGIIQDEGDAYFFQPELAMSQYGWILQELGRYNEAIDAYRHALILKPDLYQALNNIGIVYERMGDRSHALECYEAALKMAPNDQVLKTNITRARASLQRQRLSICMIVKDGEETLPACLESVKGLADEIVVVDTGSADRTVEVAKQYGAKVHFFEWCDDFSAARNESLKYATEDWIIWLDDDDILPYEEHKKIRKAMQHGKDTAFFFVLDNVGADHSQCLQLRMFPNRPGVKFSLPIHEQVTPSLATLGIKTIISDIRVVHTGYTSSEVIAHKLKRYSGIIDAWLEAHPEDYVTRYHAAMTGYTLGEFQRALQEFQRIISEGICKRELPHLYRSALVFYGRSLIAQGRHREAVAPLEEALSIDQNYELTMISLAECYTYLREPDHALSYLLRPVPAGMNAQVDFLPLDPNLVTYLRHLLLGRNYEALERYDEAFTEYRTATQLDHQQRTDAPVAMFALARKLNRRKEGIEAMERCIIIDSGNANHWYNLGVLFMEEKRYDDAKRCFREAISRETGNAKAYLNLGYILRNEGDPSSAEEIYRKAIEVDPGFSDSYANLGYLCLEMERYNEAIETLSVVREREGDLLDIDLGLCTAYAAVGMIGHLESMIEDIGRIIGVPMNDTPVENLMSIGEILLKQQMFSCARFAMMAVLHLHPDHPLAAYELARIYVLEKNYWKAIPIYEKLIVNNTCDSRLFKGLGECYRALNVPEAAALCEEQVKKICKDFSSPCR